VHRPSPNASLDEGPNDAVRRLLAAAEVVALNPGSDIALGGPSGKLIALESGLSCLCTYTGAGCRRIIAFHFPGDFCNLHRSISPGSEDDPRIAPVAKCSFRVIPADPPVRRRHVCYRPQARASSITSSASAKQRRGHRESRS
jgi:hypothetical protein